MRYHICITRLGTYTIPEISSKTVHLFKKQTFRLW